MANKDDIIQHFIELTGVSVEIANFYLESSNWNIETALSSYYTNDGEDSEPEIVENRPLEPQFANKGANNVNATMKIYSPQPKKHSNKKSNIATLSSIKQPDSDDDEERHGQAFYVGGSEHGGGQQVLGPPKGGIKPNTADLDALFKSAQSHGAEVVSGEPEEEEDIHGNKPFSGSGFRLGDSSSETKVAESAIQSSSKESGPQTIKVNVKIWSNGFSVDNGPLRSMTEPTNLEFLRSLSVGHIPNELLQEHKFSKIDLNMEDHSGEEYREAAKPKVTAFQGAGKVLGSPTPSMVGSSSQTAMVIVNSDDEIPSIVVNDNEPVTQVQIRLADNSRAVARLNYSHTVGDIRRYIVSRYPQYRSVNFVLMTTFPNKLLSDDSLTLEGGNLLNSVLVQRLI